MPRVPATSAGIGPDGLEIGSLTVRAPGLIDSGADKTLVPYEAIAPLGIDFEKLAAGAGGRGPGGELETRQCQGTIRWDKVVLMTEFTVAEPGKGPDAVLLGRADFFHIYIPRFHWHKDPPVFDLDPIANARLRA